jgi:hypothetical protein
MPDFNVAAVTLAISLSLLLVIGIYAVRKQASLFVGIDSRFIRGCFSALISTRTGLAESNAALAAFL